MSTTTTTTTTTTRQASIDEIAAEMDRRGTVIERLEARLAHIDGIYRGAIDNLQHHQRQLDQDGIEVAVSRQAPYPLPRTLGIKS